MEMNSSRDQRFIHPSFTMNRKNSCQIPCQHHDQHTNVEENEGNSWREGRRKGESEENVNEGEIGEKVVNDSIESNLRVNYSHHHVVTLHPSFHPDRNLLFHRHHLSNHHHSSPLIPLQSYHDNLHSWNDDWNVIQDKDELHLLDHQKVVRMRESGYNKRHPSMMTLLSAILLFHFSSFVQSDQSLGSTKYSFPLSPVSSLASSPQSSPLSLSSSSNLPFTSSLRSSDSETRGSSSNGSSGHHSSSSHRNRSSSRSSSPSAASVNNFHYPSTSINSNPISRRLECTAALSKCTRQMTCGMALHDYRISCKQELYGSVTNCSELCQLAMISLVQTSEGNEYLNCDCGNNDYCRLVRNRTKLCYPRSKTAIREQIQSCKGAELYCKSDSTCSNSHEYYRGHCKNLLSGKTRECSRRCNNTINLLYRQKYGNFLKNCTCDSNSSSRCKREKENIMRYCIKVEGYKASHVSRGWSLMTDHRLISDLFITSSVIFPIISCFFNYVFFTLLMYTNTWKHAYINDCIYIQYIMYLTFLFISTNHSSYSLTHSLRFQNFDTEKERFWEYSQMIVEYSGNELRIFRKDTLLKVNMLVVQISSIIHC